MAVRIVNDRCQEFEHFSVGGDGMVPTFYETPKISEIRMQKGRIFHAQKIDSDTDVGNKTNALVGTVETDNANAGKSFDSHPVVD